MSDSERYRDAEWCLLVDGGERAMNAFLTVAGVKALLIGIFRIPAGLPKFKEVLNCLMAEAPSASAVAVLS